MGNTSKKSTSNKKPALENGVSSSLPTHLAETAWRVAVPFLVFSLGGIWIDSKLDSDPWFTLLGIVFALMAVSAVVYKFVAKNYPDTFKKDKK